MTHHKVIAEDSLSAMDEISKVLGKDAVILETKKINGKIEIVGSNNIEDIASSNAKRKSHNQKTNFSHLFSNHSLEQNITNNKLNSISEKVSDFEPDDIKDHKVSPTDYVNIETFKTFTNKIENLLQNMIISDLDNFNSEDHSSITISLLQKGYSKHIISEFKNIINKEVNLDPELVFYHSLAKRLVSPCEDIILNADIIFINGSSGSGKTTLSSKIASHILDNKFVGNQRHKLSIVDFGPKSSNHSELMNFGRLLNLNVSSISTLDNLQKFIEANKDERKLIIDVSQENKNIMGYIEYLKELCTNKRFVNILAIQSGNNKNSIKSQVDFYKESNPIIGLTKLDESYVGAEELSVLGELKCKIGILSGSRSIISSLAFAKKEVLAQYMKDMSI